MARATANPVAANGRPGPLGPLLRPLGRLTAPIYGAVVAARNRRFDRSEPARLSVPVVSVGNLSAGGTGKSPVVRWIARLLVDAGHRPVIAMRGYKAQRGQRSDEQMEHECLLPNVPVVANPDRTTALRRFLSEHRGHDVVILDDGFQHRYLHRDLDLVLIDVTRSPFDDALLPLGTLREPIESLRRADGVIVTRVELAAERGTGVGGRGSGRQAEIEGLVNQIEIVHGRPPLAMMRSMWSQLECDQWEGPREPGWLSGKSVVIACAIGNPKAFIEHARRHGATVEGQIIKRDHAAWGAADLHRLLRLAADADGIFTTVKDWTKMERVVRGLQRAGSSSSPVGSFGRRVGTFGRRVGTFGSPAGAGAGPARLTTAFIRAVVDVEPVDGGENLRRRILEVVKRMPQ